jgi:hypothetical protein
MKLFVAQIRSLQIQPGLIPIRDGPKIKSGNRGRQTINTKQQ